MFIEICLLIVGMALLIKGADFFVEGSSKIAKALKIPSLIIGLTIVAVGTSLPELVTSIVASIKKENDIALGNVVGSNIFNIIFILGTFSTISTLTVNSIALFDMLIMLGSGIIIMIYALCSKNVKKWQGILILSYMLFI